MLNEAFGKTPTVRPAKGCPKNENTVSDSVYDV